MSYEKKDNSGTLGKNRRKEKETHPDSSGSATIDGVEYWISGWTKTGPTGEKFSSLSFKRKVPPGAAETIARGPATDRTVPPQNRTGDMQTGGDDDLPF